MKKAFIQKSPIWVLIALAVCLFSMTCAQQDALKPSLTNQVVSIYHGDTTDTITSYQATVKTYYQNNRSTKLPELTNEYRLSLKAIDGQLRARIDLDAGTTPDKAARAILSDGVETVVLNTTTSTVEQRLTLPASQNRLALLNDTMQSVGRLNLDSVKAIARKLSLDISDATPGVLQLNVPAAILPALPNNAKVSSYKINFDITESVLVNSEMVIVQENGTIITVTTTPVYQEDGEALIKVGEQTVTSHNIPGKPAAWASSSRSERPALDISDSVTAQYATAGDIPEVSAEELAALQATGEVSKTEGNVILGDLTDASYTETQLTVYEEVKLNTLADSLFRMDL